MDSFNVELVLLLRNRPRTLKNRIIDAKSISVEGVSPRGIGQAQDLLSHCNEILHRGTGNRVDPFALSEPVQSPALGFSCLPGVLTAGF